MATPTNTQQQVPTPNENLVIQPETTGADELGDFMLKAKAESDAASGVTSSHPDANADQNKQVISNQQQEQQQQQQAEQKSEVDFDSLIDDILGENKDNQQGDEDKPDPNKPVEPASFEGGGGDNDTTTPPATTEETTPDTTKEETTPPVDNDKGSEENTDADADKGDKTKPEPAVSTEGLDKDTEKLIKQLTEDHNSKISEKNIALATAEEDARLWKQRYEIAAKANKEYVEQADNAEFQMNNMSNVPAPLKEAAYFYKKYQDNPEDKVSQRDLLVSTSRLLRSVTGNAVNIDNILRQYLAGGQQQPVGNSTGGGGFNQMINPNSPKPTRSNAQAQRNGGFVHQQTEDIIF